MVKRGMMNMSVNEDEMPASIKDEAMGEDQVDMTDIDDIVNNVKSQVESGDMDKQEAIKMIISELQRIGMGKPKRENVMGGRVIPGKNKLAMEDETVTEEV